MTLTFSYDLHLGFVMCYDVSMTRTHWWPIFSIAPNMKVCIGYGDFQNDLDLCPLSRTSLNVLLVLNETNTVVPDFFKCVHKQRFYKVRIIWPLQIKRFDLGKNGRCFRTQPAKGYLYTTFKRNLSLEFESESEYDANFIFYLLFSTL